MSDREYLQLALESMARGNLVSLPRGEYYIEGPLSLSGYNGFDLNGNFCHIHQRTANQKTLILAGCSNGTIRGFILTGKGTELVGASSSFNGVSGIYLQDCHDVEVHSNYLFNHAGGGIRWSGTSESINVHHNRVNGIGTTGGTQAGDNGNDVAIGAIATQYNTDIEVSHNQIRGHCFGVSVNRGDGIVIANNLIRDIPGQHGMYLQEASGVVVSGNHIKNIAYIGIKTQVAKINTVVIDTLITDNVIHDVGQTGISVNTTTPAGDASGFEGVTVSNNKIRNVLEYGVQVKKAVESSVKGNEVRNAGAYGILAQKYTGKVEGNEVYRTGWSGIYAECAGPMSLINNEVYDAVQNPEGEDASSRTRDAIEVVKADNAPEGDVAAFLKSNTITNRLSAGVHYTNSITIKPGVYATLIDNIDTTGNPPVAVGGTMDVIRSL